MPSTSHCKSPRQPEPCHTSTPRHCTPCHRGQPRGSGHLRSIRAKDRPFIGSSSQIRYCLRCGYCVRVRDGREATYRARCCIRVVPFATLGRKQRSWRAEVYPLDEVSPVCYIAHPLCRLSSPTVRLSPLLSHPPHCRRHSLDTRTPATWGTRQERSERRTVRRAGRRWEGRTARRSPRALRPTSA